MNKHDLNINEFMDMDDFQGMGFYTKGHYRRQEFIQGLKRNFPKDHLPSGARLEREYWHFVPVPSGHMRIIPSVKGKRGAVPVTEVKI